MSDDRNPSHSVYTTVLHIFVFRNFSLLFCGIDLAINCCAKAKNVKDSECSFESISKGLFCADSHGGAPLR